VRDRKLLVRTSDAATVIDLFERFAKVGSATKLVSILRDAGITNRNGRPLDKGAIYRLLNNRVYLGEAVHKGTSYRGEHQAIISQAIWDRVHAILSESPRVRAGRARAQTPALLKGLLFGPTGDAMSPTHTRRRGRLYRYYISQAVLKRGKDACPVGRVSASEIEAAVVAQLRGLLSSPEVIVATWRSARKDLKGLREQDVREQRSRRA
jgi:site-specific DNA recombinase